jgi:Response regulator of the LytR/AlgR family
MNFLSEKIPTYINEKGNVIRLIVLTAVFALVFINIYKPFSSSSWYNVSDFKFFVFSSLIILTGILVVVISRIIMYYWTRKHQLTLGSYLAWIFFELFFMALFYTLYTCELNPERDILDVFRESFINTALIIILPYSAIQLYFSYMNKSHKLEEIEHHDRKEFAADRVYTFRDEKGELKLSVAADNLLYVESADNYVKVWYINKGKTTAYMLRNTMKTIEAQYEHTPFMRCHRSYIVNFDKVQVMRRTKTGIFIEFGQEGVPDIPISKMYSEQAVGWFIGK